MREDELVIYRTNRNNGFRVDYDYYYHQSRLNTNWANPVADIGNKINFLNQFRCRIPYAIADAYSADSGHSIRRIPAGCSD